MVSIKKTLIFMLIAGLLASLFILSTINMQVSILNSTKLINNSTNKSDQTVFVPKVVCEECHMSGKSNVPQAMKVQPHINGGNYCLICHHFQHNKHPIDNNVVCSKCHINETIPMNGPYIVCINCHDYPNPLNKSYGNLITIHRERGISCITCHASTCTNCHKETGTSERWEKRLAHFHTILG